jgi:hypothetical protein
LGGEVFLGVDLSCLVPWVAAVFLHLMWLAVIILARSNQNYPSVAPMSQRGFWSHKA